MKFEEFQRVSKNVKTVISKFRENPGKFASIVLQMYWDMKEERDTLINDIEALREKNERLEEEKDDILLEREYYNNGYKDMTRRGRELESKYSTLTDHIRLKAEINPSVDRYIDLVNYIDKLERD